MNGGRQVAWFFLFAIRFFTYVYQTYYKTTYKSENKKKPYVISVFLRLQAQFPQNILKALWKKYPSIEPQREENINVNSNNNAQKITWPSFFKYKIIWKSIAQLILAELDSIFYHIIYQAARFLFLLTLKEVHQHVNL